MIAMLGRDSECRTLADLVESARAGHSGALVIHGEAGIGKSELLEYVVGLAQDMQVTRVAAVELEVELPFAALHQLCAPMMNLRHHLPAPQSEALGVAFGLENGPAPDRFRVGLAVLNLLSETAREGPVLCAVDDAQWLDRASAVVLACVARRLQMESVLLVITSREAGGVLADIPDMPVTALSDVDARELILATTRGPMDARVRDLIVAEARGNPLALLELPRSATPAQLAGGYGVLTVPGAPEAIEENFRRQFTKLPSSARWLLLIAAADSLGSPVLLWRAAEFLNLGDRAVAGATESGLIEIGTHVVFRHPLVRSAVYRAASPASRRIVHRALAASIDAAREPDWHAWHRAQAASAPDEEIADELQQAAGRARARGGTAAAAAFLERSVDMTLDPARRVERGLSAAEAKLDAGGLDAAESLVASAEGQPMEPRQRARSLLLRGFFAFARDDARTAPALFLEAARLMESVDAGSARDAYLETLSAAIAVGAEAEGTSLAEIAESVRAMRSIAASERPGDALLHGMVEFVTQGPAAGAPLLRHALDRLDREDLPSRDGLRWIWLAGFTANLVWDFPAWERCAARLLHHARDTGSVSTMQIALNMSATVHLFRGELTLVASLSDEERAISAIVRARNPPYSAMGAAAFAGREGRASLLIAEARQSAKERGEGIAVSFADWAAAVLYNGLGRHAAGREAARRAADALPSAGFRNWALSELIEAAARTEHQADAANAMDRLAETTAASDTDWALGVAARSKALLTPGAAAEGLYREAITRFARTALRPDLARARLLFGEWLRRQNRLGDAREHLRQAYSEYAGMGMNGFAERARSELAGAGERAKQLIRRRQADLTAQERQICRLVANGATNAEVAARLFISTSTVEYHLHKAFRKFDVSSRTQLAKRFLEDAAGAGGTRSLGTARLEGQPEG